MGMKLTSPSCSREYVGQSLVVHKKTIAAGYAYFPSLANKQLTTHPSLGMI